jgi:hypothetical protein
MTTQSIGLLDLRKSDALHTTQTCKGSPSWTIFELSPFPLRSL